MTQGVYDKNSVLITDVILDVLPEKVPHKVINQLLDGSWDLEIIGTAAERVSVSIITDYAGKTTLDAAEATGETVTVITENPANEWDGVIAATPSWKRNGVLYFGEFVLLVMGDD